MMLTPHRFRRSDPRAIALLAGLAAASAAHAQPVSVTWIGVQGPWSQASGWPGGVVPNNNNPLGTTYNVTKPGGTLLLNLDMNVTLNRFDHMNGSFRIDSGRQMTLVEAVTVNNFGQFENVGTLTAPLVTSTASSTVNGTGSFNIGTFNVGGQLTVGGTYTGSVINVLPSGVVRGSGGGSFNNVTFNLDPAARPDSVQLNTGAIRASTINGSLQLVRGSITDGLTLNGTMSGASIHDTVRFLGAQTIGGNATFSLRGTASNNAPSLQINAPGAMVTLDAGTTVVGGWGTIFGGGGSGLYDGLTNKGVIRADTSGQTISLSNLFLRNEGLIEAMPGAGIALTGAIDNLGTIRLHAGASLTLGDTAPINGTIDAAQGFVNLVGDYDLQNTTLALGPTSGTWRLGGTGNVNGAQIRDGTITTTQANPLLITGGTTAKTLQNVAFDGWASVESGTLRLDGGTYEGTITAKPGTQILSIGNWSTSAQFNVDNAEIIFDGVYSFDDGFDMDRQGGSVTLHGTVANQGRTLALDEDTGSWNAQSADIIGGRIRLRDGATLTGVHLLDGVEIDGLLRIESSVGSNMIRNGLTGGTVEVFANGGRIRFDGDQSLSNSTVRVDGPNGQSEIEIDNGVLTVEKDALLRGGDGRLNPDASNGYVENFGQIIADRQGRTFRVEGAHLTNFGTLAAENGGLLEVWSMSGATGGLRATGAGSRVRLFPSSGAPYELDAQTTVSDGGVVSITGPFTNTGDITLTSGGALEVSNAFTTANLGSISSPDDTGIIRNGGVWTISGALGLVDPGLSIELAGGRIIGGTITGGVDHGISLYRPLTGPAQPVSHIDGTIIDAPLTVGGSTLDATDVSLLGDTLVESDGILNLRGSWINQGAIHVQGRLGLDGELSPALLTGITRTPTGQVTLLGTLNRRGQLVTLAPEDLITGIDAPGTLIAGEVRLADEFTFGVTGNTARMLTNALTGFGTLNLEGGELSPDSESTLNTLTIGPVTTVEMGNSAHIGGASVINQGVIQASSVGEVAFINPDNFLNQGIVQASGGQMFIGNPYPPTSPPTQWNSTGSLVAASGQLHLGGSFPTSALDGLLVLFGTVHLHGEMNNAGDHLVIGPGGVPHLRNSMFPNARGVIRGGTVSVQPGSNLENLTLDNVTLNGAINGTMTYSTALTLNGSHFGGARFIGDTTVNDGDFFLTSLSVQDDGHIILGPDVLVRAVGDARITGDPDPGPLNSVSLENRGTIVADIPGNSFEIDMPHGFTNHGLIRAADGGLIEFASSRPWSNQGVMRAEAGGTIRVAGLITPAKLGTVEVQPQGTLVLAGQFDLQTSVFNASVPGGRYRFVGELSNGTLATNGAATLEFDDATLRNMTLDGNLTLLDSNAIVRDGLRINGSFSIPAGKRLDFGLSQTLHTGTINLLGTPASPAIVGLNVNNDKATLIIAAPASIIGPGQIGPNTAQSGTGITNRGLIANHTANQRLDIVPQTLINEGTIEALNGATVRLGVRADQGGLIVNTGTIRSVASTLELSSAFHGSLLSGLDASSSVITIVDAAIDNAGNQIHLQNATNSYQFDKVTIRGGSLRAEPGVDVQWGTGNSRNTLDDVALTGTFNFNRATAIKGGLDLTGQINLASTLLIAGGNQSIHSGTIVLGVPGGATGVIQAEGSTVLTIEPGATIRGGTGTIQSGGNLTTFNRGLISADVPGQSITISTHRFINQGLVQAINGGSIIYNPPLDEPGYATNDGTLIIGVGSAIEASGTLELTSSSLLEFLLHDPRLSPGSGSVMASMLDLDGDLQLTLTQSYQPRTGDRFALFNASVIEGQFASLLLPSLEGALFWDTTALYSSGSVGVIPAAGSLPLLALGFTLTSRRRR